MINVFNISGGKVKTGKLIDLKKKGLSWATANDPDINDLKDIEKVAKVSIAILKEALHEWERPRIMPLQNASLIVIQAPYENNEQILVESVVILVLKNEVITIHQKELNALKNLISTSSEKKLALFGKTVTELTYTILDEIIKSYFEVIDKIEDRLDVIENQLLENPDKKTLKKIFETKKTLIYFHKALIANREVVNDIEKGYVKQFDKKKIEKFRDLHHDIAQLTDITTTYRDLLTGALDIYLSSISNSLNRAMKKLTVYASYVMVPTLISGIYGMNFRYMPEIMWDYGYYFALSMMVFSILALHIFFKREKWI